MKTGDIITQNGRKYQITLKDIGPETGHLGGEIVPLSSMPKTFYVKCTLQKQQIRNGRISIDINGSECILYAPPNTLVEINVPNPLFKIMTAKQASQVEGIVGKFVAVQVAGIEESNTPLVVSDGSVGPNFLHESDLVLLFNQELVPEDLKRGFLKSGEDLD